MSEKLDSLNPATGDVVGTFPVHTAAEVNAAVDRARSGAAWWRELGYAGRRARLRAWRTRLVQRVDEIADLIHRENGKPVDDGFSEVVLAAAHLNWAAANAARVLGRRRVAPGMLAINHTASVSYLPYGVIGVIGPWNYPVHTPLGSISCALAAGNGVVFKPSEYTPAVGAWLAESFASVVPEQPVFQLVTGFGETGAALCRAGVDKLAFTGSAATGKKIMTSCADTLTPVLMECGGKDALIIADDADLDAAVDATVWGGLYNAGQTCSGVERVYAVASVYDDFVARVTRAARLIHAGTHYGPMTMPAQIDVVRRHIDDALARGGRAVVGGPDSVQPPYVEPVVLVDVPEDAAAVQEETFGPTLTITRVRDVDEAIERANANPYGLGGAVFSAGRGEQIANRLSCGMVSVNSALTYAAVPGLPWGGSRNSGFGRIHGPDGLREFARPRAVTHQRFAPTVRALTFRRTPRDVARLKRLVKARWGRQSTTGVSGKAH